MKLSENKCNYNLLIEMYQNTSTATQSINDLIKKSKDKMFIELLNTQYQRYLKIQNQIEKLAQELKVELKDINWFEKAKMWTSIQMGTLNDNSTRHLAELMLVGTVMGTLTCYKNKVDYPNADQKALSLLKKLESLEEKNFNELKKYLKG